MKRISSKASMFFLMFLLGLLLVYQFKSLQSGYKYVMIQDLDNLYYEIANEKAQIEQYKVSIQEKQNKIAEYSKVDDLRQVEESLNEELENVKKLAGLTPVYGQGVIIIISDGDRELLENEDPNNVMVHDIDIRNIITDLRNAGAEAISINGQRVVFGRSKIYCNGPTIKVDGNYYAQPFVIKAIGDKTYLESSINAPGQYGNVLKQWGIFVEINTSVSIDIAAYGGNLESIYLENVGE